VSGADRSAGTEVYRCTPVGWKCTDVRYHATGDVDAWGVLVAAGGDSIVEVGDDSWSRMPERRRLIVEAALEVIADQGVNRTTHRAIAERARVPLGSLTYHFDGLDDLICQGFRRLAGVLATRYRAAIARARTRDAACEAVADLICGGTYADEREMVVLLELYAYGNHSAGAEAVRREWMAVSRDSLAVHFDSQAQRAIDALIEGWTIHRLFAGEAPEREAVLRAVRAVALV
jgi:DNA-binding transcriptional regulator YbjK